MAARKQKRLSTTSQSEIESAIRTLEGAQAVLIVAVAALMHQNAEHDRDVGRTLRRHVSDPLDIVVEQLTKTFGIARDE